MRFAIVLALVPAAALAADFVGAESCKACHAEAFAAWRTSKHARAFESLSTQQKNDARCASCHAPDLREQKMTGVSCETCHGGGQYYAPQYVMKDPELSRLVGLVDPSERQCRSCHDASSPSLRPFEFAEKLKLIDHWSEERARRKATQPKKPPPPTKKKALKPTFAPEVQAIAAAAPRVQRTAE